MMAIALELIYDVSDESGDTSTTTVRVPGGFTLSQYSEFGAALADLIDNIVGGRIDSASLCLAADVSALTSNITTGSDDVEDIAAFQFRTSEGRSVRLNVPGMIENVVVAGSDDLDQADPTVAAVISMMEDGIAVTGGTIAPSDVAEDDIVSTEYARERFRSSGKRRS